MKIIFNPDSESWNQLVNRPSVDVAEMDELVRGIFLEVKSKGDLAVKKYTRYFDRAEIDSFLVTNDEFEDAENKVSDDLKSAILTAASNIEKFHKAQQIKINPIETTQG